MSCRVRRQESDEPGPFRTDPEHLATLTELARRGQESTFRDLAGCLGLEATVVDALWRAIGPGGSRPGGTRSGDLA